jgi:peptidoglycan hydrolase-like protein with peptidoglycan-binding domain
MKSRRLAPLNRRHHRHLRPLLRFGSQGPLVEKLQRALEKERFYEGRIDGDFGERTIRAVLSIKRRRSGRTPTTASSAR